MYEQDVVWEIDEMCSGTGHLITMPSFNTQFNNRGAQLFKVSTNGRKHSFMGFLSHLKVITSIPHEVL